MSTLEPLRHHAYALGDDELLAREASQHLAKLPQLQLVGELLTELRRRQPSWWAPETLRGLWSAADRMQWLAQRADVRQRITTTLTGLPPKAARKKSPAFQAELIDAVLDEGDVEPGELEEAFDPFDLVAYGPAGAMWRAFRDQMPADEDDVDAEALMGWLLRALLADQSPTLGIKRRPVLTALEVRTAIDGVVWHTHMPLEVRVAIDEARFRQERLRPGRPFVARHDLAIALPEQIAAHIPFAELVPIVDRAEEAMGFGRPQEAAPEGDVEPPTEGRRMVSETRELRPEDRSRVA